MTTISSTETRDIFARIKPVLEEHREFGENERQLAPPVVDAMTRAGVFRAWIPRALGGLELDPVSTMELVESVAAVDGSAGWVTGNAQGFPYFCQSLPDESAREILASPDVFMAGAGFPYSNAVPVAGGFRLTGRHTFGSGSKWADYFAGFATIDDGGKPRLGPDGAPALMFVFMPKSDVEIVENWNTMGMRGTGSNDLRYENVFVPTKRTFPVVPFDNPGPAFTGPLYKGGMWYPVCLLGAVGLGIGRAAVDAGVQLAIEKTPSYLAEGLANNAAVQRLIGRAEATVSAARAYLHKAVGDIYESSQKTGARATLDQGVQVQLASSNALEAGARATEMIHEIAGTTGVRREHRLQQYFRDAHTISQHAFASAARYDSAAKVMLGRQSDWGFFYL